MNILVLETSTTSAKALLYNTITQAYQWESKPFDKLSFNGITHDPKRVYKATLETAYKLLTRIEFKDSIDLISIVTTWHSLIVCDKELKDISPCYLWSSLIGEPYVGKVIDTKIVNEKTGCVASSMYPLYKLQYLMDENSFKDDLLVLDQGSYNYYQLSGKVLTTAEMASGTGFYNSEEARYDKDILGAIGLGLDKLPKVYTNELNTYKMDKDNLLNEFMSKETIVLPATPDGAMNQLGSVGTSLNKMTVSVGTSGALRVLSHKHIHSLNASTWSYSLKGKALIGAATSGACNCVDLEKQKLFDDVSYSELEDKLNEVKQSLTDNFYLPFVYGERSPGFKNNRSHGFVGDNEEAINRYHSVLEGVLFNMYQCYLEIVELVGEPEEIHLSGGILNSSYWTQMCSDIFNKTLIIDEVLHSSMFGGVVFAYSELDLDVDPLFKASHKTIYPNKDQHNFYMSRFKAYLGYYNNG